MQQAQQADPDAEPDHTGRGPEEHDPERDRDDRDCQAEQAAVLLDESRAFGRAGVIARGIAQTVEIVDDECAGAGQQGPMQRPRRAEGKAGHAREGDSNRGRHQAREGKGVGKGTKGHVLNISCGSRSRP